MCHGIIILTMPQKSEETPDGTFRLNGAVNASPGDSIVIDVTVSSPTEDRINPGTVTVVPSRVAEFVSQVRSNLPDIQAATSTDIGAAFASSGILAPETAVDSLNLPTSLSFDIEGVPPVDQQPGTGGSSLFDPGNQTIPIPLIVVPAETPEELIESIPDLRFEFSYSPDNPIDSFIGNWPSFTIELPSEELVEFREFRGCSEKFPRVESDIEDLDQQTTSILNTLESRAQTVEDAAQRLTSLAPADVGSVSTTVGSISEQIGEVNTGDLGSLVNDGGQNALQQLTPDLVAEIDNSELRSIRDSIQGLPSSLPETNLSSLNSNLSSIQSSIDGIEDQECKEEFQTKADELESRIEDIEGLFDSYTSDLSRLRDLLSDIDDTEPLDCAEQNPSVASTVDQITSRQKTPQNIEEARSTLEDLRDGNLDVSDPACVSEFSDKLNEFISSDASFDCAEQIPSSLNNRVEGFATEVRNLGSIANQSQKEDLVQTGNEIRSDIESADIPEECKSQLVSTVISSLNQLDNIRGIQDIDCSSEYPEIRESIISLRSQASRSISPSSDRVGTLVSDGQRLTNRIQNEVSESECRQEFLNQVQGIIDNIQSTVTEVRILEGPETSREGEREERIVELQEQVNTFLSEVEFENIEDLPEEADFPET